MLSSDIIQHEIIPFLYLDELYKSRYTSKAWYSTYLSRLRKTMDVWKLGFLIGKRNLGRIPLEPLETAIVMDEPEMVQDIIAILNQPVNFYYLYRRAYHHRSINIIMWLIGKYGIEILDHVILDEESKRRQEFLEWLFSEPKFVKVFSQYPLDVMEQFPVPPQLESKYRLQIPTVDDVETFQEFLQTLPESWIDAYQSRVIPHLIDNSMLNVLYEVVQDPEMLGRMLECYNERDSTSIPFVELLLIPEFQLLLLPHMDRMKHRLELLWTFDTGKVFDLLHELRQTTFGGWNVVVELWLKFRFPSLYLFRSAIASKIVSKYNWVEQVLDLPKTQYSPNPNVDLALYKMLQTRYRDELLFLVQLSN